MGLSTRIEDETATAIRAIDLTARLDIQIDLGMAERDVGALASDHGIVDMNDFDRFLKRHLP
jgi:hypothetical protein